MSNAEASQAVMAGFRMASPPNCPPELYQLMLSCWNDDSEQRPTFAVIVDKIKEVFTQLHGEKEVIAIEEYKSSTEYSSTPYMKKPANEDAKYENV